MGTGLGAGRPAVPETGPDVASEPPACRLVEGQPAGGLFPDEGDLDQTLFPPRPLDGLPLIRLS